MRVWVDDLRPAPEGWWWAQTPEAFRSAVMLSGGNLDAISFDHDLGDGAEDGHQLISWLEEEIASGAILTPRKLVCHSANPAGRRKIELAIGAMVRRAAGTR